jgi:hypothetical protein
VAPRERKFVMIEGFMASSKDEHEESCNCGGRIGVDTHTWIVPTRNGDQATESVVAEVSPRMKQVHRNWNHDGFESLREHQYQVRITGWVMWDQEHKSEVGHTRGTIWEVHPINSIRYHDSDGVWKDF